MTGLRLVLAVGIALPAWLVLLASVVAVGAVVGWWVVGLALVWVLGVVWMIRRRRGAQLHAEVGEPADRWARRETL